MKTDYDAIDKMMSNAIEHAKERRKQEAIGHYVDILNGVLDQKRDNELSILLDGDGFDIKEAIAIIDKYDKKKKAVETGFEKAVKVVE